MYNLDLSKDMDFKTFSLLEDQLNNELLLHKKYLKYSNMFFDNELRELCITASDNHKNNYKRILSYLESSVS